MPDLFPVAKRNFGVDPPFELSIPYELTFEIEAETLEPPPAISPATKAQTELLALVDKSEGMVATTVLFSVSISCTGLALTACVFPESLRVNHTPS